MKETMGQIIKRLRKERGFTQEELAEQIGVTFQAVSKWENDTGMPDISQVVPLATVFDVSTDVLFGLFGTNTTDEVNKIIEEAFALVTYPATTEMVNKKYDRLHEGLTLYPNNTTLLMHCLETGIALAYPNNDIYDNENGEDIYHKCITEADLVIKYCKNTSDVMRAHMIMVLLHAAYGNFDEAKDHASVFPWRADMTIHKMYGYIARWEKNLSEENKCFQTDYFYHIEAMLDDIVDIAMCAYNEEKYDNAIECLKQALSFIELICKDEEVVPRFHVREVGDIHLLLAKVYMKTGKIENTLSELRTMVDYDLNETSKFEYGCQLNSPLLHDANYNFYWNGMDFKKSLMIKLNDEIFDEIRETESFKKIMETVLNYVK